MIESAIVKILRDSPEIVNLTATQGIFPGKTPNGYFPAIAYQRISGSHEHDLQGAAGLANPTIQCNCWSTSYAEAKFLSEFVRAALQGFRGVVDGDGFADDIHGITLTDSRDLYVPPTKAEDVGVYGVSLDFSCWVVESIPTF